jgi:F-type H+/Na+-transporting ATPase subunit alpha
MKKGSVMKLKPDEISALLEKKIENYNIRTDMDDVGQVMASGDGIARVYGLDKCMNGEMLEFESGIKGIALNLEEESIGCVLLGNPVDVFEGMNVRRTFKPMEIPVGNEFLGRVINPLSEQIDGKGDIRYIRKRPIEFDAPEVLDRQKVTQPMQTGIMAIDSMIPIGKGQRELIIGDRQTGKTAIAVDAIMNQKNSNVICIYVAIGQKASSVASIVEVLEKNNAMHYTIVISANAADSSTLQYLAPYSGCAMAEYFMYEEKRDVLIIYDDLSKHAVAYRAMSLLLRRPPGREAYPGDVFYLHARLLERAAKLGGDLGGGSMTALPIIETQAGDLSSYIPTNVISITDGQIYLESELFFSGQRPAVNVGLSVSRVGGSAQIKAMKKVSAPLRINLAQYRELVVFTQFGSDVDKETKQKLEQGKRLLETFKQSQYSTMSVTEQIIILYCAASRYLLEIPVDEVRDFNKAMLSEVMSKHPEIQKAIEETGELDFNIEDTLKRSIEDFRDEYVRRDKGNK